MQVTLEDFGMVDSYEIRKFYRNISYNGHNYYIHHAGKNYGLFHKIENALIERDSLEQLNWNEDLLFEIGEVGYNKYFDMKLPPFPKKRLNGTFPKRNKERYIYMTQNNTYSVQKCINGQMANFGVYKQLTDARKIKNYFMKNGWDKEKLQEVQDKFNLNRNKEMRYISCPGNVYYVRRQCQGKLNVYFKSKNLKSVKKIRNSLEKHNWEVTNIFY